MTTLQTEVISNLQRLAAIEPEWTALCDRTGATPFQYPEWLLPYRRSFGCNELHVIALRSGGALAALMPMELRGSSLSFIGAGLTDYQDAIIGPEHAAGVRDVLTEYLHHHGCELDCIRWDSPLRAIDGEWTETNVSPVLTLPATVSEYEARLSTSFRRKLTAAWRAIERRYSIYIESAQSENAQRFFKRLSDLHTERWQSKGMPGVLSSPEVQQFHLDAIPGLAASGRLWLCALRAADEVIGLLYILLDRRAAYYYIGGFSPAFDRYSPGSLLLRSAIHRSIEMGLQEVHFLRGAESYKYRWKAEDRPLYRLQIR